MIDLIHDTIKAEELKKIDHRNINTGLSSLLKPL